MTRAALKHCEKMPDAREELNSSVREGIIESRHSVQSLDGINITRVTAPNRPVRFQIFILFLIYFYVRY